MTNPIPRVVDLSHHNTIPSDFSTTKSAGIVGIIHKITEGSSYVDSKVQARSYLADQSTLLWGLYHFLRPGDMKKQAQFFINKANELEVIDGNTLLAADHEDSSVSLEDLKKFLDHVEGMTGHEPVIYSGHVLKDQILGTGYRPKQRLWLAQYASSPSLPEGFDKYWMWQYTDEGVIPGINYPVDLNDIGDNDLLTFMSEWSGTKRPVPPPVTVPRLTISSNVPIELRVGPNIKII